MRERGEVYWFWSDDGMLEASSSLFSDLIWEETLFHLALSPQVEKVQTTEIGVNFKVYKQKKKIERKFMKMDSNVILRVFFPLLSH